MSQPPFQPPIKPSPSVAPQEPNTLGTVGFVASLISLAFCGFPSLFAMIISLVALRRKPAGLAMAGVGISFLGLLALAGTSAVAYFVFTMSKTVTRAVREVGTQIELSIYADRVAAAWQEDEQLPDQATGQALIADSSDAHGNGLIYRTDGTSFTLVSRGADGELDTPDDVTVGPFYSPEEAINFTPDLEGEEMFTDLEAQLEQSFLEQEDRLEEFGEDLEDQMQEEFRELDFDLD